MTTAIDCSDVRMWYAEEIRLASGVTSRPLIEAFERVPRERFLGSGPWHVMRPGPRWNRGYEVTSSDRCEHIYHDVLVAIDSEKKINNGMPSAWAAWLEPLEVLEGDRIVHVGCGTGYYTAILAELVGESGAVTGLELDEGLARRACRNLASWPHVQVLHGDASRSIGAQDQSAIVVSAGVAALPLHWLDCLAEGGRLLLPLAAPEGQWSVGAMILLTREASSYRVRVLGPAGFYPCIGTYEASSATDLRHALHKLSAGSQPKFLRIDPHEQSRDCWLHGRSYCLSEKPSP